jgi:hypothetical protein
MGPERLLNGSIISDSDYKVSAIMELRSIGGDIIMRVATNDFSISKGMNRIESLASVKNYEYGSSQVSNNLRLYGRLDGGEYVFCILIFSANGLEISGEDCRDIAVEDLIFLDLLQPNDRDTIDNKRPNLLWNLNSSNRRLGKDNFRITLVHVKEGNESIQAMFENTPIYSVDNLRSFNVTYPAGIEPLQPGQTYAWMVQLIVEGVAVAQSEIWQFTVRPPLRDAELKYAVLRKGIGNDVYNAPNHLVFISLQDGIDNNSLRFKVTNSEGLTIDKFVDFKSNNEGKKDIEQVGRGLYRIDLNSMKLGSGLYSLFVYNTLGEEFKLNVRIN